MSGYSPPASSSSDRDRYPSQERPYTIRTSVMAAESVVRCCPACVCACVYGQAKKAAEEDLQAREAWLTELKQEHKRAVRWCTWSERSVASAISLFNAKSHQVPYSAQQLHAG